MVVKVRGESWSLRRRFYKMCRCEDQRCRARLTACHHHRPDRRGAPTGARAARHGGRNGSAGCRRRRGGPPKGRECRGRGGRDGLRHGRDASLRGQPGRRRLHADPVRRRPLDLHRFPRDGAGQSRRATCISMRRANSRKDSIEGWRSSGVPGTVRGFQMAVEKYGKRSWAESLAPAIQLARGFPVSYALAGVAQGVRRACAGSGIEAHLPEERRVLRRGRNARAAGTRRDARAHREERRQRILRRRDREALRRGDGEARRHHHRGRSQGLQGDRAHAAEGQVQELHRDHGAAVELRRHCAARDAGHPRRHEVRGGRIRLRLARFTTWPRRCAAPTPIATSTSAIPRS